MSPLHFVQVRTTYGGPAPKETGRAIGESATEARMTIAKRWQTRRDRLTEAEARLAARVKAL